MFIEPEEPRPIYGLVKNMVESELIGMHLTPSDTSGIYEEAMKPLGSSTHLLYIDTFFDKLVTEHKLYINVDHRFFNDLPLLLGPGYISFWNIPSLRTRERVKKMCKFALKNMQYMGDTEYISVSDSFAMKHRIKAFLRILETSEKKMVYILWVDKPLN